MVSVSPAEATQQRRGRKSEKELLEAVESAVSNFPELEELEESVLGKLAAVRDLGWRDAGLYRVDFDGRDDAGRRLAPGVWFIRVRTSDGTTETLKLLRVP